MNEIVGCRGLHKTYFLKNENIDVLQGVDLEVGRGDFVVVLGPSGSGKSTLLNILGSLDHPTRGQVRFDGEDLFTRGDHELSRIRNAKIGFVFQFHHLLSEFSAQENIALPALERGMKRKDALDRAGGLMEKFDMADKRNRFPDELSGGERQRVAVARALVNDPLLILADEPTGNLDGANTAKLLGVFARLKEENRTIILVTHSLDIAKLGTHVYNLKEGKLI